MVRLGHLIGKYSTRADYTGKLRTCGKRKSYYWCRWYCDERNVCEFIRKK